MARFFTNTYSFINLHKKASNKSEIVTQMIYGESLISEGRHDDGVTLIKKGWITAKLSKSDLRYFRKKYKKYLNKQDYINRVTTQNWHCH